MGAVAPKGLDSRQVPCRPLGGVGGEKRASPLGPVLARRRPHATCVCLIGGLGSCLGW